MLSRSPSKIRRKRFWRKIVIHRLAQSVRIDDRKPINIIDQNQSINTDWFHLSIFISFIIEWFRDEQQDINYTFVTNHLGMVRCMKKNCHFCSHHSVKRVSQEYQIPHLISRAPNIHITSIEFLRPNADISLSTVPLLPCPRWQEEGDDEELPHCRPVWI